MFENWQKLVSTEKLFFLFLRISLIQVLNSVVEEEQSIGQIVSNPNHQVAENIEHSIKRTGINRKEGTDKLRGNVLTIHEGEITRTRSGCIIRKPDRLTYIKHKCKPSQHVICIKNVIQLTVLFHNSKHLFV